MCTEAGGSACGWSYAGACGVGRMRTESRERLRVGLACACEQGRMAAQALLEPISLFDDEIALKRARQAVLVESRTLTSFVRDSSVCIRFQVMRP